MRGYRGSLNYNALDKRCKRTCNEITKCVSKEYDARAKRDIANLATATRFSQVIQSRRSPQDHKTDDRALKRRLIASRPLGKHIVGKLCFPCSLAIRFFEIYGIEIDGALITLVGYRIHTRPLEISRTQTFLRDTFPFCS